MSSALIDRLNIRFWQRCDTSTAVPEESLGVFRWIWGLYQLVFNAWNYSWVGSAPRAFFDPPVLSGAYVLGRFPPRQFFVLLDLVVLGSLCCIVVGYRTRVATAALLVARLLGDSFVYSFGYLGHDGFIYGLLLCMILADWGRRFSVDSLRAKRHGCDPERRALGRSRGLALLAVMLSFGFLAAGIPKAQHWFNFDLSKSGILSWYYGGRYSIGRTYLLAKWVPGTPRVVLKIGDWLAPLVECTGFVALLRSRRTWLIWLLLITALFLCNALILNIEFANWAVSYLVFVDLSAVARKVSENRLRQVMIVSMVFAGSIAVWHITTRLNGAGSTFAFVGPGQFEFAWDLYSAIPVFVIVMVVLTVAISRTNGVSGDRQGTKLSHDRTRREQSMSPGVVATLRESSVTPDLTEG